MTAAAGRQWRCERGLRSSRKKKTPIVQTRRQQHGLPARGEKEEAVESSRPGRAATSLISEGCGGGGGASSPAITHARTSAW